jgi:carboxymethylenebutenolidase
VRTHRVSASATHQPGRPKTRMVAFGGATEKVAGFLALPRDQRLHRAIIVVHEWWGLNEWVKEQAERLAANGYVALAVDLYNGKVATDPSEARKLKRGLLRQDRAIGDLKAAFDYLAGRTDVDAEHIGSLGWSMGGGLALQLAIHEPNLAACVVNYGFLPTSTGDIQKINARVLGIFGSLDRGIAPGKVRAFERCMNSTGKRVDIKIYGGAGHAFENPSNQRGYRPKPLRPPGPRSLSSSNKQIDQYPLSHSHLSCEMMGADLDLARPRLKRNLAANVENRVNRH